MPEYVTRTEFEARVGVLEGGVEGEKMVTRHILQQTRHNGDDLAAIRTRITRVENDVGQLKNDVGELRKEFGQFRSELRNLRTEMPGIVGEAVREVIQPKKGR